VRVSAAQTRDLTLNAGCGGFLNDVDVVTKSHSNLLNARTPEKMINDRSGFRLNRQHCIPRIRSVAVTTNPRSGQRSIACNLARIILAIWLEVRSSFIPEVLCSMTSAGCVFCKTAGIQPWSRNIAIPTNPHRRGPAAESSLAGLSPSSTGVNRSAISGSIQEPNEADYLGSREGKYRAGSE
jgi:hypothetical protein